VSETLTADGFLGPARAWARTSPAQVESTVQTQSIIEHNGVIAASVLIPTADATDGALLLEAALAGDEGAFVALYRRWQGPLFRFTLHMCGSDSLAEDVTQEVFVALAEVGQRFDPQKGRLSSYLFGMARNIVRRRLRREQFYEALEDDQDRDGGTPTDQHPQGAAFDPAMLFDRESAVQLVRRAVCALPVSYREAVVLCDLQEMTYAEAASVLSCPVGTVRSRLHRGRALLAERLAMDRSRGDAR
jgi:RNA polymerase sigma-70 factor, ECF subfamily